MGDRSVADRLKDFGEVDNGLSPEEAIEEAGRCLQCKKPACVDGCPVNIDIPAFVALIAKGEFLPAAENIRQQNLRPAICGRVCPQETQCEQLCVRGFKGGPVGIGRLERFAADYHMALACDAVTRPPSNGIRVAVVGSGPAGLTCAGDLAKLGYDCLHRSVDAGNYARNEQRVDLLYAHRPIARRLLAAAAGHLTPFGHLRVISAEGLIGLKVQALANNPRRTQDLADIRALLQANRDRLDFNEVREYFRLFDRDALLDDLLSELDRDT